jgi:hypothetical protein
VTYTAQADELLRQAVEDRDAAVEGSLRRYLTENELVRVFSLRSNFSAVFQRLLHAPVGTDVRFRSDQPYVGALGSSRGAALTLQPHLP